MLARSILALQSFLVLCNFASAGESNAELAPESLKARISGALERPQVVNCLPAVYLWILNEIEGSILCEQFFGHICENCNDSEAIKGESGTAEFWSGIIDYHFPAFARVHALHADTILYLACTTGHPLAAEIESSIGIKTFLDGTTQTLGKYLNATVRRVFKAKFSEPAAIVNSRKPLHEFRHFVYRYKKTVASPSAKCKCAYAFLMNAELQVFTPLASALDATGEGDACSDIEKLALIAYEEMDKESPEKSTSALRKLLPTIYDETEDKSYANVMSVYAESGLEPANAEEFRQFALEALKNNRLTRYLSPVCLSVLKAIAGYSEECQPFFAFISEEYNTKGAAFEKDQPLHWELFVNESFGRFSQSQPDAAKTMIDSVIIPDHAILSQGPYRLDIDAFNSQHLSIEHFLRDAAKDFFVSRVSEIIANPDAYEARLEFGFLIQRASECMRWQDPKYQYACAFLMRIGVENLELAGTEMASKTASLFDEPNEFASHVYARMITSSAKQARKAERALRMALPEVLSDELDPTKAYMDVVEAYTRSGCAPIDMEYFRRFVRGALEESNLKKKLSAAQLCIMHSLRDGEDSKNKKMFFWYTFENYVRQDIRSEQTNPVFWHSLIFCCLFEFSQEYPKPGYEVIGTVFIEEGVPATPQQVVNMSTHWIIELGEALTTIMPGYKSAEYPAKYGHTATVMYLLRDNIPRSRDEAVIEAATHGHIPTLTCIIGSEKRLSGARERALVRAASQGRIEVIEYLADVGTSLNINDGEALVMAAGDGCVHAVKYLFESKVNFSSGAKYRALLGAARSGSTNTLKYVLNSGLKFSAEAKENALFTAAEGGKMESVKHLIEMEKVDPAAQDGESLVSAAISENIPLFEYLADKMGVGTKSRNERAMLGVAKRGRKDMVKYLIEERGVDANAQNGQALVNAAESGFIDTLKYLIERGLDVNMQNGIVFATAMRYEDKKIVKYLFKEKQVRPNETQEQAFLLAVEREDQFSVKFHLSLGIYSEAIRKQALKIAKSKYPVCKKLVNMINSSLKRP